ncbi:MFS transporter [Kitasatospora sp. NPDC127111]|uniref:MFS transporter n=1 Tax=Kitasatospora sp. NPDC127111 TaxID=3345363 RepID=UPI0036364641
MVPVPERTPRSLRPGFALLGAVQATLIFTIVILSVPLPLVAREFGFGPSGVLLLSAAYGLSFSSLLLLGGRLTDRNGGRRMLRAGLLLLAATAGNLLSGAVTAWTSWRWLFAVPVLVALAGLALSGRLLPAAAPTGRTPGALDLRGAALATAGVCAGSYGLVAAGEHGWRAPLVLLPLAAGAALLLAFAAAERRTTDPLLPPGFLADRRRATALAAVMATAAGTALTFLLVPLYLQQVCGSGVLATSAAFLPYAAVLLLAGRLAAPLAARYGAIAVTAGGLAVAAGGLALLAGLAPGSPYATGLLPGLLLLPAGAGPAFAGASVLATDGVPPGRTGLAAGVLNTAIPDLRRVSPASAGEGIRS